MDPCLHGYLVLARDESPNEKGRGEVRTVLAREIQEVSLTGWFLCETERERGKHP